MVYLRLALSILWSSVGWSQTSAPNVQSLQERWDSYVTRAYDWKTVSLVTAESAFEQTFQVRKCGRPPYCFPHHVGGSLIRRTTRLSMELGAGALLGEDLRRWPSGLPGFRRRVVYALVHAPLAKGPHGEWRPAYSRFTGTMASVAFTSAWQGRPMTTGALASSFGWSLTNYFQDSLLAEFEPDLRRLGLCTWHRIRGK